MKLKICDEKVPQDIVVNNAECSYLIIIISVEAKKIVTIKHNKRESKKELANYKWSSKSDQGRLANSTGLKAVDRAHAMARETRDK